MKKLIFTFDGCPKWIGYQTSEHNALFDIISTAAIIDYHNQQHAQYPEANWDHFKWHIKSNDGILIWYSFMGEEEGYCAIEVMPVMNNGAPYYPLGAGSWEFNIEDIDQSISLLADKFSESIRNSLTDDELANVRKKNAKIRNAATCATHDYIDSNMNMYGAFEIVFGREHNLQDEKDLIIWERAWAKAKLNDFR